MTNKITETPWHTMQVDEVIGNLATNVNTGLNLTEVEDRLRKYGHNQLEEKEGVSPIMLFLSQFNDFIVWVLIAAAIVCHYWIYPGIPGREIPCCITKNVSAFFKGFAGR
ncbi:MAG: pacL [Candidatus Brocadiaceae bacterium]|nr:pacL [Candidatus Brocadiaceae bacterium]